MYHQNELEHRQKLIIDLTYAIEEVNRQMAMLRLNKEQLELDLIAAIGHEIEGSKSYDVADRVVTLKTDMIYSLDKKAYANGDVYLSPEFDPVMKKISFEVNKKLFALYEQIATPRDKEALARLIEKKPAKPSVTIKVRT